MIAWAVITNRPTSREFWVKKVDESDESEIHNWYKLFNTENKIDAVVAKERNYTPDETLLRKRIRYYSQEAAKEFKFSAIAAEFATKELEVLARPKRAKAGEEATEGKAVSKVKRFFSRVLGMPTTQEGEGEGEVDISEEPKEEIREAREKEVNQWLKEIRRAADIGRGRGQSIDHVIPEIERNHREKFVVIGTSKDPLKKRHSDCLICIDIADRGSGGGIVFYNNLNSL